MPWSLSDDGYSGASPPIFSTGFSTWNSMYGPCSSLTPASLPVSPSLPVPPFTPFAEPPATPLPLKSFSLVIAFDRSIEGSLVGTLTTGGRTLNPFGGAGASTFGNSTLGGAGVLGFGVSTFLGGGGGSFFGGGGGSFFFTSTNLTFSALTLSGFLVPALAVAKTARKMISECNITLKMVPPADRPFLSVFLDSSSRIMEGSLLINAPFHRANTRPKFPVFRPQNMRGFGTKIPADRGG